ncbi:MAG TPA: response regulator transcription factor [Chloroflexota bacterium]|jgi:DNA-binding NarL/FixJ family response regulator
MGSEALVLVVDDEGMIRRLLRNALSGEPGVRVVLAADGEEGLLRAWELGPALVLADLLMPGIDGATFCRLLRAHPATAGTPVVAISGADPLAERALALREQCVAWVAKPFRIDELLAVVRRWLPGGASAPAPRTPAWTPLTPREREIAALVARGLTNQQIAEALVLEKGTVANHVQHILLKLALRSRTQLGVWVAKDAQRRSAAGL